MVHSQKRRPSEQDNICPSFSSTSFKLTIPQFHYMTVKSLGFLLDSTLSMENFIRPCQICKSCYYQLRRISSVSKYLSTELQSNYQFTHSLTPRLLQFSPFSTVCFLCPYLYSLRSIQNCAVYLIH